MNCSIPRATVALVVLLLVGAAHAADDGKGSKVSGDVKKLQGTWTTPSTAGGDDVVYTLEGDKLAIKASSREYKMTVKLDESAKPDKTIDFHVDQGPEDAKG